MRRSVGTPPSKTTACSQPTVTALSPFVDCMHLPGDLGVPADARGLVLIAHANSASLRRTDHRFVADVLQANGFATLAVALRGSGPALRPIDGSPPDASTPRLAQALAWRLQAPGLAALSLGILALPDAAVPCMAAVARLGIAGMHALVVVDAEASLSRLAPAALPPMLVLAVGSGAGACEAVACQTVSWMRRHLPPLRSTGAQRLTTPLLRSDGSPACATSSASAAGGHTISAIHSRFRP
jgi:hypothetical protein